MSELSKLESVLRLLLILSYCMMFLNFFTKKFLFKKERLLLVKNACERFQTLQTFLDIDADKVYEVLLLYINTLFKKISKNIIISIAKPMMGTPRKG